MKGNIKLVLPCVTLNEGINIIAKSFAKLENYGFVEKTSDCAFTIKLSDRVDDQIQVIAMLNQSQVCECKIHYWRELRVTQFVTKLCESINNSYIDVVVEEPAVND
jgi:hypothetical protein